MAAKHLKRNKDEYPWKYFSLGGITRVNITSGADIANLEKLDQKLWTVLSCPIENLEFDANTLKLIDSDNDGKIKVNEIISTAKWLTSAITNKDLLLKSEGQIALAEFNLECNEGKQIHDAAKLVLKILNKESDIISLADSAACKASIDAKCAADAVSAAESSTENLPYGDNSDAALAAYKAVKSKVADYFMRCKLISFDEECQKTLDVSIDKISSISSMDLSTCGSEIATYPLARPNKTGLLPIATGINPAWQDNIAKLKSLVFDVDFAGKAEIDETEWASVAGKLETYEKWKESYKVEAVGTVDKITAEQSAACSLVDKFLHIYRDFYHLLRNYIVFTDFYSQNPKEDAIFRAGRLFIDQRCCELCIRVTDMTKHGDMAGLSGMYLIYCKCTSKVKNASMDIAAVLTDGDISDLRVGKNAVFYDRNGHDWDATVTKIIDNPISIRQAFWSPYRKLANWINERIDKMAADKESKVTENLTKNTETATTNIATQTQQPAPADAQATSTKQQAFDIAKFCGIFAAIGMAIGYIGGFLVSLGKGFVSLGVYMPLGIIAILLLISGPSMFIAWRKLRRRDLGPVLNANGWAINARVLVNTKFGATLTSIAKYPAVKNKDPFKKKSTAWIWILAILLILGGAAAAYFIFFK